MGENTTSREFLGQLVSGVEMPVPEPVVPAVPLEPPVAEPGAAGFELLEQVNPAPVAIKEQPAKATHVRLRDIWNLRMRKWTLEKSLQWRKGVSPSVRGRGILHHTE
jgi:hypothetical protein